MGRRPDEISKVTWHVAMRQGKSKALDKTTALDSLKNKIEHIKDTIRTKVEHPFRVVRRQFGYTKVGIAAW